jgi:hypothetical protein
VIEIRTTITRRRRTTAAAERFHLLPASSLSLCRVVRNTEQSNIFFDKSPAPSTQLIVLYICVGDFSLFSVILQYFDDLLLTHKYIRTYKMRTKKIISDREKTKKKKRDRLRQLEVYTVNDKTWKRK